jgi:hypothetical protein
MGSIKRDTGFESFTCGAFFGLVPNFLQLRLSSGIALILSHVSPLAPIRPVPPELRFSKSASAGILVAKVLQFFPSAESFLSRGARRSRK